MSDDLEVLLSRLVDQGGRIRPEGRLKAEMAHAAVPALGLAVGREIDEAVAGNSLLANRSRKPTQLLGIVEVAGRPEGVPGPAAGGGGRGRRAGLRGPGLRAGGG